MAPTFRTKYLKSFAWIWEKSEFHVTVYRNNYYQESSVFLPKRLDLRKRQ